MPELVPPPLSLYIHFPWCERKCPYCDFNSHETKELPEAAYIDALLRDLHADCHYLQGRPVNTLFIGGGTPSLMSAAGLARLLSGVRDLVELAPDLEATMEANPGSAEAEKFAGFQAAGINRLSIGIQSFQDELLQQLGRVHNADQAHAAVELAQQCGFDSFNIDLMHGLPRQSPEAAQRDLHTALALQPPHLSWYQLTIEPNTVFHSRPPILPVEDVLADIQLAGEELLASRGMAQYEVSAYSHPDHRCRHNLNYWRFGDYLGIGAGAHGKITIEDKQVVRYAKRRQPGEYLASENGRFTSQTQTLGEEDLLGEFMLNNLRLIEGLSLEAFNSRTGLDSSCLNSRLDSLASRGLLEITEGKVSTTSLGRRFLDTMVAEFFPG